MVFYKELQRRGTDGAAGGPISGQFKGAAAEATDGGTYLLAKTSTIFNAAQVEGDTPQSGPSCRDWRCGWRAPSASWPPLELSSSMAEIGPTTGLVKTSSSCRLWISSAAARATTPRRCMS